MNPKEAWQYVGKKTRAAGLAVPLAFAVACSGGGDSPVVTPESTPIPYGNGSHVDEGPTPESKIVDLTPRGVLKSYVETTFQPQFAQVPLEGLKVETDGGQRFHTVDQTMANGTRQIAQFVETTEGRPVMSKLGFVELGTDRNTTITGAPVTLGEVYQGIPTSPDKYKIAQFALPNGSPVTEMTWRNTDGSTESRFLQRFTNRGADGASVQGVLFGACRMFNGAESCFPPVPQAAAQ